MKYTNLTPEEKDVIEHGKTEPPYSGEYEHFFKEGTFICRKCTMPLYSSEAKFDAHCGWPSFDKCFENAIQEKKEPDGRTEISCARCGGHLGHVFRGEGFTTTNTRHCVNSLSVKFIAKNTKLPQKAS